MNQLRENIVANLIVKTIVVHLDVEDLADSVVRHQDGVLHHHGQTHEDHLPDTAMVHHQEEVAIILLLHLLVLGVVDHQAVVGAEEEEEIVIVVVEAAVEADRMRTIGVAENDLAVLFVDVIVMIAAVHHHVVDVMMMIRPLAVVMTKILYQKEKLAGELCN